MYNYSDSDILLYLSATICSGTSSVALAWSGTFDDLIGGHISTFFKENASMGLPGLAPYPDVFAAVLVLLLSGKMMTLTDVCNNKYRN